MIEGIKSVKWLKLWKLVWNNDWNNYYLIYIIIIFGHSHI
jgi:hypothetical protein